jgi:hypothetical protein
LAAGVGVGEGVNVGVMVGVFVGRGVGVGVGLREAQASRKRIKIIPNVGNQVFLIYPSSLKKPLLPWGTV